MSKIRNSKRTESFVNRRARSPLRLKTDTRGQARTRGVKLSATKKQRHKEKIATENTEIFPCVIAAPHPRIVVRDKLQWESILLLLER